MVLEDIGKVIYAPHKAFKHIIKKASYVGPIILLVIFLIAQVGSTYLLAQKQYIESTVPDGSNYDVWTENASYWMATGATVSNNTSTYISAPNTYGYYYGTTSIQFNASNTNTISMMSTSVSANSTYTLLSFSLQIVSPTAVAPSSVSLILNSGASTATIDLTSTFSNASSMTSTWYNITVPLFATGSESANWANITGMTLTFTWPSSENVNLLLDGVYFRGPFVSELTVYNNYYGAGYVVAQFLLTGVTQYLFYWIILSAIMFIMLKLFKVNSNWKTMFISVGFALIVLVVQYIALAILFTATPSMYLTLPYLAGLTSLYGDFIVAELAIRFAVWIWLVILGTFVIREISKTANKPAQSPLASLPPNETPPSTTPTEPTEGQPLSWTKSIAISAISVVITIVILLFLGAA